MRTAAYILILWGVFAAQIQAQEPHLRSKEWTGLMKGNNPTLIEQDRQGLTWLGSDEGLFYYDGEQLSAIAWHDTSLENGPPHIRSFHQSPDGTYWVGTQSGKIYRSGDIFHGMKLWQIEEGHPKVPVIKIVTDTMGNQWFATYGEGLYVHDGKHLYNINEQDDMPGVDVYDMVTDDHGCIWAGTDAGLVRCRFSGGTKDVKAIGVEEGLPDEIVTSLCMSSPGKLLLGTHQQGVVSYSIKKGKFEVLTPELRDDPINALASDGNELWIGSERHALSVYDGSTLQQVSLDQQSIQRINDLMIDAEKNLWVLTETPEWWIGNLWFRHLKTPFKNIQAVLADEQSLWLGTQSGLYRAEQGSEQWSFRKIPEIHSNVISLYKDSYGVLWLGTFGDGIICYHPSSGKTRRLRSSDGLINESILSMDGRNDTLWLASLGGVMEVYLRENILNGSPLMHSDYNHENQLGTNYIYQVVAGDRERCYFATDGKGVAVLNEGTIDWIARSDSSDNKSVYSVAVDQIGNIWFSTQKGRVYFTDGLIHRPIVLPETVYQKDVSSITFDGKERMLITYPEGIDLVDTRSKEITHFDEDIGLVDFNPFLNAHARGPNEKIWIGHENGLVCYIPYPEQRIIKPRIVLPEVSLYLDPITEQADRYFSHNQNHFTFEYFGLWYTDPTALAYRYKLEGYDFDWKMTKDRQALYSNLPPGDYTFKVQVTQDGGFENAPTASYSFTIAKPIWSRWWFISGVLAVIVLIVYLIIKSREHQLKREENLKRDKVASQYETLKSQINPHFLFNSFNTLISVIEDEPEIAVEYVEKLSDFYRSILQYRERDLIGLDEELQLIEDYRYLLDMRYHDRLNINLPDDIPEDVMIAPLTLQILMENAIKHNVISKHKPLDITVCLNGNEYIIVSNTFQKKMTRERSTGFGLESIVNRYDLLTDRPVQIKRDDERFTVKIPIIKTEEE